MTQINEKMFCAHGLDELILLKCLYYPKQPSDFINLSQNANDIFHSSRTDNPRICVKL